MSQNQPPSEPTSPLEEDWGETLETPASSPESSSHPPDAPRPAASGGTDSIAGFMVNLRQWGVAQWHTLRPRLREQWEQARPQVEKFWNQVSPQLAKAWQQVRPVLMRWTEAVRPLGEKIGAALQPWWQAILSKIRIRLPESLNQQLSDRVLTGAIAGVLVLLLWFGWVLTAPSPAAVRPPTDVPADPIPPDFPPTFDVPMRDRPLSSPPPLDLPPDRSLIAAIQEQVAAMTTHYADGLIQSVQANFRNGTLVIIVTSQWYGMPPSQQDELANEMLRRSQELAFTRLEITDSGNTLLARSPVVGDRMVILQRRFH